ncbi:MAG: hypothetical protein GX817_07035, partial [Elusimicrobia bacterium]|nr:hypothetical protein [Elusimicrobiota bacterium]
SELYILGDLFAYWFEHPGVDLASGDKNLKALKEFVSSGKKVVFVRGNRDFTVSTKFKEASGIEKIVDDITVKSGDRKIFMTHGDFLAKRDIRYQIWRKFIRSPIAFFVFRHLPMGAAVKFADKCRGVGKNRPAQSQRVAEMISSQAEKILKTGPDALVAGHAHWRLDKTFKHKGRLKEIFILDEFRFPGEFLTLKDGEFSYRHIG